jgi:hypothetical protein
MSDPAGWYADPTSKHELRYWDGYAWADNVSDRGVAATDPLGGTPLPPPSEAQAKAQQGPAPGSSAPKSKTPLIIGAVAAVVVIAVVAFLLLRGGDDDGRKVTQLGDQSVTLTDQGKDANRPSIFPVNVKANTVVLIDVDAKDDSLRPGVIIEAKQAVVDELKAKIEGIDELLSNKLKNACKNLREEDLGATGDVAYFFVASDTAGETLKAFTFMPVAGEFEFIPVGVDDQDNCKGAAIDMTLNPHFLDFTSASNSDDLNSILVDDPQLSDFSPG